MSAMADEPKLDDLQKLKRFFYFGNENNLYVAGCPMFKPLKAAVVDTGKIVREFVTAERGEVVVAEVASFLKNESVEANRGPALFALAVCARHQDESKKTKQAAMKVLAQCVNTSADLFAFVWYCCILLDSGKGWGRSLKKGIQKWFDARDGMTLAKIISQQKVGYSWSYVDLLRVAHVKPKTEGAKLITNYIIHGLRETQEKYGGEKSTDDLQAVLAYLAAVEEVKKATNEVAVAALVDKHRLPFCGTDGLVQQLPQVLVAYSTHMTLKEIVDNFGCLAARHILEPLFPHAVDVTQRLNDQQALLHERISPIAVLYAIRVYEKGAVENKWTLNKAVKEALSAAFDFTVAHYFGRTDRRYLLAINLNRRYLTNQNWAHGARPLQTVNAAAGLAIMLLRSETDVTVGYFNTSVHDLKLAKDVQLSDVYEELVNRATLHEEVKADLSAPLTWASEKKLEFDVFILFTDFRHPKAYVDLPKCFREYRQNLNLPKAKFVVIGVTASHVSLANADDPSMLDVAGFDSTVPDIIQRFVADTF